MADKTAGAKAASRTGTRAKQAEPKPRPARRRLPRSAPEGSSEEVAMLMGKQISQAALGLLRRAIPDELVRDITAVSAPLTRYSGRTRVGAAALSRGLKLLLAQPPAAGRPITDDMTLAEIAARVDRPVATVRRWADAGLLGLPAQAGRVRKWGRAGLEHARLGDYLLRHGVAWKVLLKAAGENRLPQLVLTQALGGQGGLTRDQVAKRAGVSGELTAAIWRALGTAAPASAAEPLYSSAEVDALRVGKALRAIFTDDDLVEATSVIGRAMHEVAEAVLELFRRRIAIPFEEAGGGELEIMLRLVTTIDIIVPTMGPILEVALRRQLQATSRAETVLLYEAVSGGAAGQVQLAVGFADIVGFMAASSELNVLEVSKMAETLLRSAEMTLPEHGAMIVKSIGDAVMFTAPDLLSACAAGAALVDAASDMRLPPLRIGVAHGPVLRAYADYFGRTVNIASRLADVARSGEILALRPEEPVRVSAWEARGLAVKEGGKKALRGVDGRLPVIRVTRRRPIRV